MVWAVWLLGHVLEQWVVRPDRGRAPEAHPFGEPCVGGRVVDGCPCHLAVWEFLPCCVLFGPAWVDEEEAGAASRVDVSRGWRGLPVSALCVHRWQAGWKIYPVMLALASELEVRGMVPRVSASGAWGARLLDNQVCGTAGVLFYVTATKTNASARGDRESGRMRSRGLRGNLTKETRTKPHNSN